MMKKKCMGIAIFLSLNLLANDSTKIDITSYNKNMDKFGYKMAIEKNKLMIKKSDLEIAILDQEKKIYPVVNKIDKINKELKSLETICNDYYNDTKKIYKNMSDTLSQKYPQLKSKVSDTYSKDIQLQKEELNKCIITQNKKENKLKQEKKEFFEKQDILNMKRYKLQIQLNSINKKITRTEKEMNSRKKDKNIPMKIKSNQYRPKICLRRELNIYNVTFPHNIIGKVDEVIDIFDLGERRVLKILDIKNKKNIQIEVILVESVTHRDVKTKGYISANPKFQRPCP